MLDPNLYQLRNLAGFQCDPRWERYPTYSDVRIAIARLLDIGKWGITQLAVGECLGCRAYHILYGNPKDWAVGSGREYAYEDDDAQRRVG